MEQNQNDQSKRMTIDTSRLLSLPTELRFEILLRLPFEDLMELKRVSRWWRDVISDVQFLRMHRNYERSRICEFPMKIYRHLCVLSLDLDLEDDEYSEVKVSCFPVPVDCDWYTSLDLHDGLALTYTRSSNQFSIYNIVTRSSLALPKNERGYSDLLDWKIAPNPSINGYTVVGLHQDLFIEDDYRTEGHSRAKFLFLELPEFDPNNPRPASSSAIWTWKELGPPRHNRDEDAFFIEKGGVRKFGKLFWLASRYLVGGSKDRHTRLKRTSLLSFDPATHRLKIKPCSPTPCSPRSIVDCLFDSNGTFYWTRPLSNKEFELWVLRELDRRLPVWVKTHVIKNDPSITSWNIMGFGKPLAIVQGIGKFVMFDNWNMNICAYDMRSNDWTFIKLEDWDSDSRTMMVKKTSRPE